MKHDIQAGISIADLRPYGIGHFLSVAHLAAWLAVWVVGTYFGVSLVFQLLGRWPGRIPLPELPEGFPVVIIGFTLVWLAVWTFGGVVALTNFLNLLLGSDRLEFDAAGVRHTRRIGPFGHSRSYPRDSIRGIGLHGREGMLVIETAKGPVAISRLGARSERARVRSEMDKALGFGQVQWFAEIPEGWESETMTGGTVLRRDRSRRMRRAQTLWAVTVLLVGAVTWAQLGSVPPLAGWLVSAGGGLLGAATLLGALWLSLWEDQFHLRQGRAERRRSLGPFAWTKSFAPAHLTLEHETEGDGSDRYQLMLHGPEEATCVDRNLEEPGDLIRLGRWMAGKLGSRLELDSEFETTSRVA